MQAEELLVQPFLPLTASQQIARDGKVSPQTCVIFTTKSRGNPEPCIAYVQVTPIEDLTTGELVGFYTMSDQDLMNPPGMVDNGPRWWGANDLKMPALARLGTPVPLPIGSTLIKTSAGYCGMPPGFDYIAGKGFVEREVVKAEPVTATKAEPVSAKK